MKIIIILFILLSFNTKSETNKIEVGNKIYLNIPEEIGFEEPFEVDKKGNITIPEIGKFNIIGKTKKRSRIRIKN